MDQTFIAVDWGTTNRRACLIRDGVVIDRMQDDCGVSTLTPDRYDAEVAALRGRFGDIPMLLAGMVGSGIGWRDVAYVPAPCSIEALADNVYRIDERTVIVPGVSLRVDRGDVMRGEEVQALGAIAAGMVPPDALVAQPGTHCKWITLTNSRIVRFVTAMTGELFALLRHHSILAPMLESAVEIGEAFREGLVDGARGDLAASLFGIRAAALLGTRASGDAASYASGLLIGSDVAVRLCQDRSTGPVFLISDASFAPLYGAAIEANGRAVSYIDSETAFVAGMRRLRELV